jgi:hypothetical protein
LTGKSQANGRPGPGDAHAAAGGRTLADIQAEGLRAASELLERTLRFEPDSSAQRRAAGQYTELVEAWSEVLRRAVAGLAEERPQGPITAQLGAAEVGPPVRLTAPGPGASAEVWMRNETFADVGPLTFHCGELTDSQGRALDGAVVRFEPAELVQVHARASRAVTASLAADAELPPGTYRGTIQARGAPELWLPLEVTISPC